LMAHCAVSYLPHSTRTFVPSSIGSSQTVSQSQSQDENQERGRDAE
jgi:hypothetical protein